jgi:hypothetical protein
VLTDPLTHVPDTDTLPVAEGADMARGVKVRVTRRALLQRIARRLARDKGQMLRAERQQHQQAETYFVIDKSGRVVGTLEDPERLGRELGVLKAWEQVAEGK